MSATEVRPARQDAAGARRPVGAALFALAIGGFGIGTTEFATMGLLPQMADDLRVPIPVMGHGITAYALGVVVGAPVIAALAARVPRRGLLLGLMLAFVVGNTLTALAPGIWSLVGARFLTGLPHGAYFGIASVVAAGLVPPDRKGRAVGRVMVGLSVANIGGVPLVTFAGQLFGWRVSYALVAGIGVLTVLAVRRWVPPVAAADGASIGRELGAFRRVHVWIALLTGTVGFGGMFAVYSYVAPTLTDVAGMPVRAVPWVLAVFGVGMTVGALLGGRLADRSAVATLIGSLVAMVVVLSLYALTAGTPFAAVLLIFAIGLVCQVLGASLTIRLMEASPDAPALAASSNHAALNLANAIGAWLGGVVIAGGHGYLATAWVGAVLSVAGLLFVGGSVLVPRLTRPATR
ncbi:MFS transporter [Micromonospora krabiensis]|uniref:MFS transporter, DHA1 family, arabinose polymer transporter n=1 Tax=Micromonospora krabiensis TaxID=307121 RepID=A0A1C3MY50_9ACTN|nr:MFS transporter [Micromonospora krabiensis]SBV25257.1 MFS transporter, DHA1 family, arabinose polymer transporter [Micromonospora krabiensis]